MRSRPALGARLKDQAAPVEATGAARRRYAKTVPVKATSLKKQYQNGILEVFVPYRKKA